MPRFATTPEFIANVPRIFSGSPKVFVPLPASVRLLNVAFPVPVMLCAAALFSVTVAVPGTNVPLLIRLPFSVRLKLPLFNVAPLLIVRGIPALNVFAASNVIAPTPAITTPPVAANGVIHSSVVDV